MVTIVGSGKHTYEVHPQWAKVPQGWDAPMCDVAVDSKDRVYGFNRGPHPVIVFDSTGKYLSSWGQGLFVFPHAIAIDGSDNVWLVERNNGQIMKFSSSGKLLMTIGTRGFRSSTGVDPADFSSTAFQSVTHGGGPFNMPAGVAISPSGEVFVVDGYGNCQVHRFTSDGTHLLSWGEPGRGPGQFRLPHDVWVNRKGQVLVADRENDRVQVFTQDGKFVTAWETPLIGPAAFYVDRDDTVYIPEHNAGLFSVLSPDGKRLARWGSEANIHCHGVAGDSKGNIYFVQRLAAGQPRQIVKYVRKH